MSLAAPDDLVEFWKEASEVGERFALSFRREGLVPGPPGFRVETLSFEGPSGQRHGWIAMPEGRNLPGFIWIPPYGRESVAPNEHGTRPGHVSLSLNFFGHPAFHKEPYRKERGYFTEGIESARTWVFYELFLDAVVAMRILMELPEVDPQRIGAMGMSQGAGISIWMGAWSRGIRAICADMPFLGRFDETLSRPVHRYPTKEITDYIADDPSRRERVFRTISYFDTVTNALHCEVPTQVSLGLKDPAARPPTVRAIYDSLRGEKRLIEYDWGHDWHPDMVENNLAWLRSHLGGP